MRQQRWKLIAALAGLAAVAIAVGTVWLRQSAPATRVPKEAAAMPGDQTTRGLEFFYQGVVVGYFKESGAPKSEGRHRYEPYRGMGHYELQTALRAGARPRCDYGPGGPAVSFAVTGCPEHGVLELADFRAGEAP
jgi:hypothetical protein